MKEQPRSVYRSMQGKEIDMNKLMNQNEMTVAVGNARINARGDELGPGGKIIKKREDVIKLKQPIPAQTHSRATTNPTNTISENTNLIAEATANAQNTIAKRKTSVQPQVQTQPSEGAE